MPALAPLPMVQGSLAVQPPAPVHQAQVDNGAFNYGMWMCANCLRPIVGSVGNEGGVEVPQDYYPQDTHVLTDETELDYGAVLSA